MDSTLASRKFTRVDPAKDTRQPDFSLWVGREQALTLLFLLWRSVKDLPPFPHPRGVLLATGVKFLVSRVS
jgi:hypothetical protein